MSAPYLQRLAPVLGLVLLLGACTGGRPPLPAPERFDLEAFMGDWYVIAHIPTWPERQAWNAVETYRLSDDGAVDTTFRFRKGGFDGPLKTMTPTGYPDADSGNVAWGMSFLWPLRAEYRIAYVDAAYRTTIIARSKRDYVWLMHRQPEMPQPELDAAVARIAEMGYDTDALRYVPQRWPEPAAEAAVE